MASPPVAQQNRPRVLTFDNASYMKPTAKYDTLARSLHVVTHQVYRKGDRADAPVVAIFFCGVKGEYTTAN